MAQRERAGARLEGELDGTRISGVRSGGRGSAGSPEGGVDGRVLEGDERLRADFGEVSVQRLVQADLAPLDALERADGGEELGAGGEEEGRVEGDGGRGGADVRGA